MEIKLDNFVTLSGRKIKGLPPEKKLIYINFAKRIRAMGE
jgi:hypothetical protein